MYIVYMALHITNPDVEREVRSLATERGQSITDLIGDAVKGLRKSVSSKRKDPTVDELMSLVRSFHTGPIDYSQTEDEILGYGPEGFCE